MIEVIAIDYDDTFSLDPEGWAEVLGVLRRRGNTVWGVTARNRSQLIRCDQFNTSCHKILYCCGRAKKPLIEMHGVVVSVWIDDKPEYIHNSYYDVHGTLFVEDNGDDTLVPWLVEGSAA